jgi:two-component system, OmpR family, sensor histidine kinase KdpD
VKLLDKPLARIALGVLVIYLIVVVFRRIPHINPATVGFTFLLAVLIISAAWGLRYAIAISLAATLAYNFFFLPPVGTFTISDPQNWVVLLAFLITAVIASQLAERARREALSANRRRSELERLYTFSQQMLTSENVLTLVNSIPQNIAGTFGAKAVGVFLPERKKVYYSDIRAQDAISEDELKRVSDRSEPSLNTAHDTTFVPLRVGVRSVGALGVAGVEIGRETLDAVGSLVAIAIERAGAVEKLAHAEANRESERLRSILLDSVTHDFRTPLTSIKASAESLLGDANLGEDARHELLSIINEESDRLDRLVGEAAEMARLDAAGVELQREPRHIREAIEAAIAATRNCLAKHTVVVVADDSLPSVNMDLRRISEVLGQLLDNAAKYSPEGTKITITSEVQNGKLVTSVADQGPGIDGFDQGMIFDKFYRGRGQRSTIQGTGMGLAIAKALVEAHEGAMTVISQLGRGSVFSFSLPLRSR